MSFGSARGALALVRVLAAFCVLSCAASCATPARPPPARLAVREDVVDQALGPLCGPGLDAAAGPVPVGARVLARLHLTATRPVPLVRMLELAAAHGRKRCASGVRIIRAEAADGATGVLAADAVVYRAADPPPP